MYFYFYLYAVLLPCALSWFSALTDFIKKKSFNAQCLLCIFIENSDLSSFSVTAFHAAPHTPPCNWRDDQNVGINKSHLCLHEDRKITILTVLDLTFCDKMCGWGDDICGWASAKSFYLKHIGGGESAESWFYVSVQQLVAVCNKSWTGTTDILDNQAVFPFPKFCFCSDIHQLLDGLDFNNCWCTVEGLAGSYVD